MHYVKSVQIRTRKNSVFGHFSRIATSHFPNFKKQCDFTKSNELEGHTRLKNYDSVLNPFSTNLSGYFHVFYYREEFTVMENIGTKWVRQDVKCPILHRKSSISLKISLVNATKSAGNIFCAVRLSYCSFNIIVLIVLDPVLLLKVMYKFLKKGRMIYSCKQIVFHFFLWTLEKWGVRKALRSNH